MKLEKVFICIAQEMPDVQLINISDREGDIIEIFNEVAKQKEQGHFADIIVRSQYDRLLVNENKKERTKLRQKLEESPLLGEIEFVVPATEKRGVAELFKNRNLSQPKRGLWMLTIDCLLNTLSK